MWIVKDKCLPLLKNITISSIFKHMKCPANWYNDVLSLLTFTLMRTSQLIWHLFLHKSSVWGCLSLPNVFEIPCLLYSPTKKKSLAKIIARMGCPRNFAINDIFLMTMESAQRTANYRSMFLTNGVTDWT